MLIGDAAHTTHFSQGFGTMFAFDDALTLRAALQNAPDVSRALAEYEAVQRPKIAGFQTTATASMEWGERLLDAIEHGNEPALHALIAARWPSNAVTESPLDPSGARLS